VSLGHRVNDLCGVSEPTVRLDDDPIVLWQRHDDSNEGPTSDDFRPEMSSRHAPSMSECCDARTRLIMSIYAQLLDQALGQTHSHESSTTGDALAQVLQLRHRLGANRSGYTGVDWAPAAVADQLAYDVALIELCRRLGVEVNLSRFGQPQHERARLEQALVARGIRLGEFDAPTESGQQSQRAYGQR
jgi:hypothetical protein